MCSRVVVSQMLVNAVGGWEKGVVVVVVGMLGNTVGEAGGTGVSV